MNLIKIHDGLWINIDADNPVAVEDITEEPLRTKHEPKYRSVIHMAYDVEFVVSMSAHETVSLIRKAVLPR